MMSTKVIQRILYHALKGKVLILTPKTEQAERIRLEIKSYVKSVMSKNISVYDSAEGLHIGGFEYVYVMTADKWNNAAYRLKFGGLVLVTDPTIQPKFIEDGNTAKRLPISEG